MDFDLTEEQGLLQNSVERLLAQRYGFEQRKAYAALEHGWSPEIWAQLAELGLLGLTFDEAHGGSGGGPVETMIVMEAFGRALVVEPYLATVVLGGGLLRQGGHRALLPRIAAGELRLAFAQTERASRYSLQDVTTTARRSGESWLVDGEKCVVLHGDTADKLLVTARLQGARRDPKGIGLFMVDVAQPGVGRRGYPTQDGMRAAEIAFSGAKAEAMISDDALPLVERVVDEAMTALAAESVGAMTAMHELTVDYLKTRKQFGQPIGAFQALQHRAVDMLVMIEQARSMTYLATMSVAEDAPAERRRNVAAAKVQIGRSARFVGQQAIQLHGGVGMTMEYKVGHYFKRLAMIDTMFGDADYHLGRLAETEAA